MTPITHQLGRVGRVSCMSPRENSYANQPEVASYASFLTTGGPDRWICPVCGRLIDPYIRRCAWCAKHPPEAQEDLPW